MTAGVRFALTISIVLAALLGLSLCGYNYWEPTDQKPGLLEFMLASAETRPELCMDEESRELIRSAMLDALDEALKEHVRHAFEVWMKDPTGQPDRAKTGVLRGIRAYLDARKGALEWAPPPCGG